MKNTKYTAALALVMTIALVGAAGMTANADTTAPAPSSTSGWQGGKGPGMMFGRMGSAHAPGVRGTVTAVNGSSITVSETNPQTKAVTTYTVDATNAKVTKSGASSTVSAIAVGDMISAQGTLSGTTLTATNILDGKMPAMGGMQGRGPGVFGTVSAVSGNTITISSKGFGGNAASTTYTVDATNAAVTKNGATSSVTAIAVGDNVMVQGTVSGTSVTATKINDGQIRMGQGGAGQLPAITGNGQPLVGGKVTAVNGNSITITNSGNQTYTVDATSAKITKAGVTAPTVSNIAVGDTVLVQGTVNGNAVTATTIVDQGTAPAAASGSSTSAKPAPRGILGAIGGFFAHMFGF